MTMACWPPDGEDDAAFEAAVRRAVRRIVLACGLGVAAAGVVLMAAWAQDAAWMPMPGAPALDPAPGLPASCLTEDGWAYAPGCCCTHGWCARIPCDTVREEAGGYVVRLGPGQHPRVRAPFTVRVPRAEATPSPDGDCHLCASRMDQATPGSARCLLVPPGVM